MENKIGSDPFVSNIYHASSNGENGQCESTFVKKKIKSKSWLKNPFVLVGIGIIVTAVLYFTYTKFSNTNSVYSDPRMQHAINEMMMREQMIKQKEYELACYQRQQMEINQQNNGGLYFNKPNQLDPNLANQLRNNPAMAQQMSACQPIDVRGNQPGISEYDGLVAQRQMEYSGPINKLGGGNQPQQFSPSIPQAMPLNSGHMGSMSNQQYGGDKLASLFIEPKP